MSLCSKSCPLNYAVVLVFFSYLLFQQQAESSKFKAFSDSLEQNFASNDRIASIHYKPTVHTVYKCILRHSELKENMNKSTRKYRYLN